MSQDEQRQDKQRKLKLTRRAVLRGKLDLTRAEALLDVIHAGSERALRLAQANLGGRLGTSAAVLESVYGRLVAHQGDYVVVPMGCVHRWVPSDETDSALRSTSSAAQPTTGMEADPSANWSCNSLSILLEPSGSLCTKSIASLRPPIAFWRSNGSCWSATSRSDCCNRCLVSWAYWKARSIAIYM